MKAPNGSCPWGATGIVCRIEEYGIIGQKLSKSA